MTRNREEGRRRQRAGAAGQAQTQGAPLSTIRHLAYYDLLREEVVDKIIDQAYWLIQEVGMDFKDSPHALEAWKSLGAKVEGEKVKAPRELIEELISHAPAQFDQISRNPARKVTIGGNSQIFAPVYGCPFVRDLEGGRRYGTINDLQNLIRLTYMLPALDHSGLVTCEPCDVPVSWRHLDIVYSHMRYSDKPHLGAITEKGRAEDSVALAKILHGEETLAKSCTIMGNVNTNSPLLIDKVVVDAIDVYSAEGQGVVVVPFILMGAMGPVTTAAAIAQALGESLFCCAYAQHVRKGAPVILGNFLSSMSLKTGAPTFGMPEPILSNFVIGQVARKLKLPLRCGGALTASKVPDYQAAAESSESMLSTLMGGANFILHSAGWCEGGLSADFEKFVLDADRLGGLKKLIKGLDTADDQFARDAYAEVEPGGHFLGSSHTMAHYQTAFHEPALSDSENVENWEERGSKDAYQHAHERWKSLLADYEAPALDAGIDEALQEFIAKRKREIPEMWY